MGRRWECQLELALAAFPSSPVVGGIASSWPGCSRSSLVQRWGRERGNGSSSSSSGVRREASCLELERNRLRQRSSVDRPSNGSYTQISSTRDRQITIFFFLQFQYFFCNKFSFNPLLHIKNSTLDSFLGAVSYDYISASQVMTPSLPNSMGGSSG